MRRDTVREEDRGEKGARESEGERELREERRA